MKTDAKRGQLHTTEKDFIKENAGKLSPEAIGKALRRHPETIKKFMLVHLGIAPDNEVSDLKVEQAQAAIELRKSPEWGVLKDEFTDEELKYFEYKYSKLMAQFKNDVTPTEESQIFLLIKYEILMNRTMKDSKRSVIDIERMEKSLDNLYSLYPGGIATMEDSDKIMANRLEERLAQAKAARNNRTTEYKTLSERYSATMKELKGTREQRITKIEDAETILDVIKSLQEADVAARLGRHQELIKIAVDRESERLSQHHKYDDGIIDQPLLTPENAL
jgi:hypothetical protein